jgi:hypothetical protein
MDEMERPPLLARQAMLAFEITVNGKIACTAGAGPKNRVLASILSWSCREPNRVTFSVGGAAETDHTFEFDVPEISLGDEISIRIIESDSVDEPSEFRPKLDSVE